MNTKLTRILLIEDSPVDAGLIQEMLREFGRVKYEIASVGRLSAGLEHLAVSPADIVLLDLGLPDSAGIETFRKIHDQFAQLPVVIVTELRDMGIGLEAMREGAQDNLIKGQIDSKLLDRSLQYAIERKESEIRLKENEAFNSVVLARVPNPILVSNADTSLKYVSPAFEDLTGYTSREVIGKKSPYPWWPAEKHQQYEHENFARRKKDPANSLERHFLKKNGESFWVTLNTTRVEDDRGEPGYFLATWLDITERKIAEIKLRESEQRYRNLFETMAQGVIYHDFEGKIISTNLAAERILGRTLAELQQENPPGSLWKAKYEDGSICLWENHPVMNALKSGREIKDVVLGILNPIDSKYHWLKLSAVPQFSSGESGNLYPVFATFTDITDLKEVETALRESEAFNSSVLINSPNPIVVTNADSSIRYVNPATEVLTGFSSEELLGKKLPYPWWPKESIQYFSEQTNIRDQEFTSVERCHQKKNGELFWISLNVKQVKIQGELKYFLANWEDITKRKIAEASLRQSEQRAKNLLDIAGVMILALDTQGKVTLVNARACEILACAAENIIGKNWIETFVPERVREKVTDCFTGLISGDLEPWEYNEKPILPVRGEERIIAWHNSVIWDENGKIIGTLSSGEDITEHRQLEEERQRSAKLESVSTLAGGIAHDFNNILTGILGNIQLAQDYLGRNEIDTAKEMLDEAEKASMRARNLTQQLLTFSKGGAPVKKLMPLGQLIRESSTFALRGSKAIPEFALPDNLWAVESDEGQMFQVISNIVINADQSMPNGGVINISAGNVVIRGKQILPLPEGNYIKIDIEDHGTGIPRNHFEKIFDPYFTTKQKGSGLGLTTTFSIIKKHSGYISFESELGVGTTFHVYLPAKNEEVMEQNNEMSADRLPLPSTQFRILVMDDDDTIRLLLSRMLKSAGYDVDLTRDGAEAIELYAEARKSGKPIDAVILDLTVPGGMGGKEAMVKLQEIDRDVKAIVSSGYASDSIMAEFKKYGFSGVVTKPYDIRQMQETLHNILGNK